MPLAPEAALGISLAITAASAAVSYQQAQEQNNAIEEANRRNADYASRVRAANEAIAEKQEQDQQIRLAKEFDLYSGAVRARGELLGAQGSQGLSSIQMSLLLGASQASANARINLYLQKQAIESNTQPNFSAGSSALLAGLGGLFQGAQSGMGFYGSNQGLINAQKVQGASAAYGNAQTVTFNQPTYQPQASGLGPNVMGGPY